GCRTILVKQESQVSGPALCARKSMHHPASFHCFIIGEGSLPIRCAELLLSRGHQICGVISADPGIQLWSKNKGIPFHPHPPSGPGTHAVGDAAGGYPNDLLTLLRKQPF